MLANWRVRYALYMGLIFATLASVFAFMPGAAQAGPPIYCKAHSLFANGHLTTYVTSNRADNRNVYSYVITWYGHGKHTYIPAFKVNTVSLPKGWRYWDIDVVDAWQAGTRCSPEYTPYE